MNGVLCIDKPEGMTSFDVIARLRRITHTRRIGHTGTLDPMATGLLPVLFGTATKACDLMPESGKRYRAAFQLGVTSDTEDIWGTLSPTGAAFPEKEAVEAALVPFRGEILQLPPMYSALSVGGKRLYELARRSSASPARSPSPGWTFSPTTRYPAAGSWTSPAPKGPISAPSAPTWGPPSVPAR